MLSRTDCLDGNLSPPLMPVPDLDRRRWIAGQLAAPMFWLSLAFLICQAMLVVLWVDVPNLRESAVLAVEEIEGPVGPSLPQAGSVDEYATPAAAISPLGRGVILSTLLLWPAFFCEAVWHWISRPWAQPMRRFHLLSLVCCLCPSLRMCAQCPELESRIWLPGLGWQRPGRRLRRRLERRFSVPMILIALLILPVLIVEFFFKQQVADHNWLRLTLHISTGVIWFSFAAEFILMISVAEKKLIYAKEHWIDLAIILLPLLSFLRSMQIVRAYKLARIPKLTKLARVFRLRGTALRGLRALLVLEVIQRLVVRDPARQIERMESRVKELNRESRHLQRKIRQLRRDHDVL